MKIFISYLFLILIIGCSPKRAVRVGTEQPNLQVLTITELQEDLESNHQKQIELQGYYYYAWETVGLFPNKRKNYEEAVWVDFSEELRSQYSTGLDEVIEGRKLRMQGVFDRTSKGHLGQYLGTLTVDFIETVD